MGCRDDVRNNDAALPDHSELYAACPSCGRALRLARAVPGTDGLVELHTFSCRECSLWVTEAADKGPSRDYSKHT
jgi:hypothetical protein